MILQDIKYAVRSLVIDRGVTVIVIFCLALGIGINATLFSLIDGVLIQPLLYNVTPTDPISFGGVAIFLTVIAFLASYLPARRAMTVDPIVALRNE